ncbi:hypothetical protein NQ318_022561 [Aromia moschata]|uniref:Transposase n=1 Tax=Aromia moschata TaxID=1265417 RepID=A0AAV8X2Z0_9CUCU|nr:hypothetical protein NQ318_022561 [Aromia moschata]
MLNQDVDFFTRVMFSDEATFHKNGFVNRHHCHYYDTVNPHQFRTINQQRLSLSACGEGSWEVISHIWGWSEVFQKDACADSTSKRTLRKTSQVKD